MGQTLEIKAKFSDKERLFALKINSETGEAYYVPVVVNNVSFVKLLGNDFKLITYSVTPIKKGFPFDVTENDLYTADQIVGLLK